MSHERGVTQYVNKKRTRILRLGQLIGVTKIFYSSAEIFVQHFEKISFEFVFRRVGRQLSEGVIVYGCDSGRLK